MDYRVKARPRRASTIFVALVTMFCVTVLNSYHLTHPDDHTPSHTQSIASDHNVSHADHTAIDHGTFDHRGSDHDGPDQFASHSAFHAISLTDPAVLVPGDVALFANWYPTIVAVFASIDPPGHLRPPRS